MRVLLLQGVLEGCGEVRGGEAFQSALKERGGLVVWCTTGARAQWWRVCLVLTNVFTLGSHKQHKNYQRK